MVCALHSALFTLYAFLGLRERFVLFVLDFPLDDLLAADTNIAHLDAVDEFGLVAGVVQVVLEGGSVFVFLGACPFVPASLRAHL